MITSRFGSDPEAAPLLAESERRLRVWRADGRMESRRMFKWPGVLLGSKAPAIQTGARKTGVNCDAETRRLLGNVDHVSLWRKDGKVIAYVSQPYRVDPEDLLKWDAYSKEHGVAFIQDAALSWHYPTKTTLLALVLPGYFPAMKLATTSD